MEPDEVRAFRDYYGVYHHHKERTAIGIVVLFLGAAATIASGDPKGDLVLAIGFGILGVLAISLAVWQFAMRSDADAIVRECTKVLAGGAGTDKRADSTDSLRTKLTKEPSCLASPRVAAFLAVLAMLVTGIAAVLRLADARPTTPTPP